MVDKIILYGLPKISLNKWYSGCHWTERNNIKNEYGLLIKSQFNKVYPIKKYSVDYTFYFKSRPLDASNCVAMVKLIEDVIFKDDKHDLIDIDGIRSRKAKKNFVEIIIKSLD